MPSGALRYANYGIGVLHFESDAEAKVFINNGFQDVVSADDYAFTRPTPLLGTAREPPMAGQ